MCSTGPTSCEAGLAFVASLKSERARLGLLMISWSAAISSVALNIFKSGNCRPDL